MGYQSGRTGRVLARRTRVLALPRFVTDVGDPMFELRVAPNDVDRHRVEVLALHHRPDYRVEPRVVAGFRELLDSAYKGRLISFGH